MIQKTHKIVATDEQLSEIGIDPERFKDRYCEFVKSYGDGYSEVKVIIPKFKTPHTFTFMKGKSIENVDIRTEYLQDLEDA